MPLNSPHRSLCLSPCLLLRSHPELHPTSSISVFHRWIFKTMVSWRYLCWLILFRPPISKLHPSHVLDLTFPPSLTNAVVSTQPDDIGLAVSSPIPVNAQRQLWRFATSVASNDYSGSYKIDWRRTDGNIVQDVSATFSLELTVPQIYNNDSVPAVVLPSSVGFGSTNPDGSPKTEFSTYDEIFVTSTVNVANNQDLNTYVNSIYNVWICYTVDGSLPIYAPDNGFNGCAVSIPPIITLYTCFNVNFKDANLDGQTCGPSSLLRASYDWCTRRSIRDHSLH